MGNAIRRSLQAGAIGVALGVAGLGAILGGTAGGWLGLLAWLVPAAAAWMTAGGSRDAWRSVGAVLVGWAPATVVMATTGLACAVGVARWDPAGAGFVDWWSASEAGRTAVRISSPATLALGQAGLVLGAPLFALPLGAAATLGLRGTSPIGALGRGAVLVSGLALLGALPAGIVEHPIQLGVAGATWGALAGVLADRWPWAAAGILASLHGLAGLGPLLAQGRPAWVGWGSWPLLVLVALWAGFWAWPGRVEGRPPPCDEGA